MMNYPNERIEDVLSSARRITVVLGQNPDLDAMAAGLALFLALQKAGKDVVITCPTPPTVALGNLVGVDKVTTSSVTSTNSLIISLPYSQGSIEKISYDIVGDRINLTVVPGPDGLSFTKDEVSIASPDSRISDLAFTIGFANESNIAASVFNIDTFDPSCSSMSEIVTKLLHKLVLPIDIDIAQNLLSGIVDKTSNFQSQDTVASAFEAAALLMQKGAQRNGSVLAAPPATFAAASRPSVLVKPQQVVIPRQKQQKQTGTAPKDWFEPKIYRGSTPIS